MRNIPRLVPQLHRLKNCATRSRPFTYLDGFLLGASTHSWRNQGRMFRPHNRIFLRGQALRTEKRKKEKKKKKKETKKRSRHSVDAGDLAEGNKNKTSLAGFHGLLTAQRNSTRDFSFQQSLSLCISSFTFYSIFILSPSTSFNEIMDQRQFLNRVTRSLIV